jgi:hypothetical protein
MNSKAILFLKKYINYPIIIIGVFVFIKFAFFFFSITNPRSDVIGFSPDFIIGVLILTPLVWLKKYFMHQELVEAIKSRR